VNIREYKEEDFERVRELHELSGFKYQLPELSLPSVFSRLVVATSSGVEMAAFLQRTAQVYLICDPGWKTPAWRYDALHALHCASYRNAQREGIAEVNAFVVPRIKKQFGSRLRRMGWRYYPDGKEWHCYTFPIEQAALDG